MRLCGRVRAAFTVDLSIRDIFDAPTVAALADRLGTATSRLPLTRRSPDGPVTAPVQRNHSGGVDQAFAIRWSDVDSAALAAAVADVIARHEPLRDPALFRAHWDAEDATLRLEMSYRAVDEWSVVPLSRDLSRAYEARRAGHAPEWTDLPVTYSDYAAWATEVLAVGDDQLAYWRSRLADLPRLTLSADRPGPAGENADFAGFVLDPQLHQRIDTLARETGTSMFMVLQAALARLLTDQGAGTDLPIGTLVAGRTEPELADLVGCFFNTLVLRTDTSGEPDFRTLLGRIRAANLTDLEHQDVPLADVLDARPQVMLVHHEQAGLPGGIAAIPVRRTESDLTLAFYEPPDGQPVACYLHYRTDLFDSATVVALSRDLMAILESEV